MVTATFPRDLLALIEQDTRLRRVASTAGGEWHGACPFCGGRDRFRVQPHAERPSWACRRCGEYGDAVSYVRKRHGYTFQEALAALGMTAEDLRAENAERPAPERLEPMAPPAQWSERAWQFVQYAEGRLWSEIGEPARNYLHARGLTDETLRLFHVGFNPSQVRESPAKWGMDGDPVWLPTGITIPTIIDGAVWMVKVRLPLEGDELANHLGVFGSGSNKYQAVRGSRPGLFGHDLIEGKSAAVLPEGEFDAMLLYQEAADLVDVATMGAADISVGPWLWKLARARRLLVAYDLDEAGQTAALHVLALSARARIARPLRKDITDMWRAGCNLRAWLNYHMREPMTATPAPLVEVAHEQAEPDVIATVDMPALDFSLDNGLIIHAAPSPEIAGVMHAHWREVAIPAWRRILTESEAAWGDASRAKYARWMLTEVLGAEEEIKATARVGR